MISIVDRSVAVVCGFWRLRGTQSDWHGTQTLSRRTMKERPLSQAADDQIGGYRVSGVKCNSELPASERSRGSNHEAHYMLYVGSVEVGKRRTNSCSADHPLGRLAIDSRHTPGFAELAEARGARLLSCFRPLPASVNVELSLIRIHPLLWLCWPKA